MTGCRLLIGAGGRGRYLAGVISKDAAVDVVGVCDVYEPNLEAGLSELGNKAKAYRNYKQVLENKEINIVIIATPEHWHHQMLLDALAAGKDVFPVGQLDTHVVLLGSSIWYLPAHARNGRADGAARRRFIGDSASTTSCWRFYTKQLLRKADLFIK